MRIATFYHVHKYKVMIPPNQHIQLRFWDGGREQNAIGPLRSIEKGHIHLTVLVVFNERPWDLCVERSIGESVWRMTHEWEHKKGGSMTVDYDKGGGGRRREIILCICGQTNFLWSKLNTTVLIGEENIWVNRIEFILNPIERVFWRLNCLVHYMFIMQ